MEAMRIHCEDAQALAQVPLSLTHTQTHSLTLSHKHSLTHSLSHTHTYFLSHTMTYLLPLVQARESEAKRGLDSSPPYVLHPTPYTLHPTPFTLHPSPCTPHYGTVARNRSEAGGGEPGRRHQGPRTLSHTLSLSLSLSHTHTHLHCSPRVQSRESEAKRGAESQREDIKGLAGDLRRLQKASKQVRC